MHDNNTLKERKRRLIEAGYRLGKPFTSLEMLKASLATYNPSKLTDIGMTEEEIERVLKIVRKNHPQIKQYCENIINPCGEVFLNDKVEMKEDEE